MELVKMLGMKSERSGWDLLQKILSAMVKTSANLLSS